MLPSEPAVKRQSSSLPEQPVGSDAKRLKRPYHRHHRLQKPVEPGLLEPAIIDDAYVDHMMNRSIGMSLRDSGFDLADPAALESFRLAAEEYLLKFASYVRQSMLSSRRLQPIPQDFEYALKRHSLPIHELLPHLQPRPKIEPTPTLLPSPPPEKEFFSTSLLSFGPQLSGEDDRVRSPYIPKHFPEFPSKHTYRHTPVFTERENDPRTIRERAAEDGRHGEEALRKLARAAYKDNQLGASGRDKKQWGRRMESLDSMFEKTIKALTKKASKAATAPASAMEIDSGAPPPEAESKSSRTKGVLGIELPPIINCERELWRGTTASGRRRIEDKPAVARNPQESSRVDSWVST